jgi:hypothetical protein
VALNVVADRGGKRQRTGAPKASPGSAGSGEDEIREGWSKAVQGSKKIATDARIWPGKCVLMAGSKGLVRLLV